MSSAAVGISRTSEMTRRRTRIIPDSTDTIDDLFAKQGDGATKIVSVFSAGTSGDTHVEYLGGFMRLFDEDTNKGRIDLDSSAQTGLEAVLSRLDFWADDTHYMTLQDNGYLRPATTETGGLGTATYRWGGVHTVNLNATGTVNFDGLPTSASGLSSGDVWNDSGTLKIV